MRFLLDANQSPRGVGDPLRARGHDVRALADERAADGLEDRAVLELAAAEGRVLVTRNSRHFAPLAREWAEAGRSHAGIVLIWTLDHSEFAGIVAGVSSLLERYPAEDDWRDLVVAL